MNVLFVSGRDTRVVRGDDNHIDLQVRVNGGVQDIAVNVASTGSNRNVDFLILNAPLRGAHGPRAGTRARCSTTQNHLGLPSGAFTAIRPTTMARS